MSMAAVDDIPFRREEVEGLNMLGFFGRKFTRINGTLFLHGVEAPVALDVEVVRTDRRPDILLSGVPG